MKYKVIICDDDLAQASNLALKLGIAAMMSPKKLNLKSVRLLKMQMRS